MLGQGISCLFFRLMNLGVIDGGLAHGVGGARLIVLAIRFERGTEMLCRQMPHRSAFDRGTHRAPRRFTLTRSLRLRAPAPAACIPALATKPLPDKLICLRRCSPLPSGRDR